MNKIRLRTETTISYYKSTQQLLKIYYENNRSMHEDFQEGTRNSSFYSNTWCSEVTRTLHQIKDVVSGLEKCTILNIERLDKFSQQNARKTNTKLDK